METRETKPGLRATADRINAYLKRFERDPKINKDKSKDKTGLHTYYNAGAWQTGAYIRVVYVSYQHGSNLRRAEAEKYLAWLDAGNVGTHYEALRA